VNRVSQTDVLNEMAYILFYIKQGSSPWFSSLMEAPNIKHTSPISVLDCRGGIFSPSSAEETSSSSSRETPEKEEPGSCGDVSPESATDEPDHSPCTSYKCDDTSHQKGPHNALTSRFQAQHMKQPNSGQIVINMDDIFHDEPLGKVSPSKALVKKSRILLRKQLNGMPASITSFIVRPRLLLLIIIVFVLLGLHDI